MTVGRTVPADNEDRWAVSASGWAVAVADGAGSTPLAGAWAEHLASRWAQEVPRRLDRWLDRARVSFSPVPGRGAWWADDAHRRPSACTLLGFSADSGRWRAVAVGDTCLAVLRDGRPECCFPIEDAAGFGLTADVVRSDAVRPVVRTMGGRLRPGSTVVIATDALFAHLLARDDWGWASVVPPTEFEVRVGELRRNQLIADDDVTLVRWRAP
jgi:hypothetical protein